MARRPPARLRQRPHPVSPRRKPGKANTLSPGAVNKLTAHKPLGKRLADSDDSDDLVVKGNGRRRARAAQTVDVYASGGLGAGDTPNSHPTRAQRKKSLEQALNSGKKKSPLAQSAKDQEAASTAISSKQTSATMSQAPAVQPPFVAKRTPLREESILNGIKPRKRQNSILLEPSLDESTLGSFALPEDENSPLHLPKQKPLSESRQAQTPAASSSSKKRKLDANDVPTSPAQSSRISVASQGEPVPDPEVPHISHSALQSSNRNTRRKTLDQDETDIMAPPMSSSSEPSSPEQPLPAPVQRHKTKSRAPPVALSTADLQARHMPAKRKQALRNKTSEFDIPSDSPEDIDSQSDGANDSTFLGPGRRRTTRATRQTSSSAPTKIAKTTRRKASGGSKAKKPPSSKQSTAPAPLLSSPARSRTPHETSQDETPAKSPSQLSSLGVRTSHQRVPPRGRQGYKSTAGRERAGGSPLKHVYGKENEEGGGENDEEEVKLPSPRKKFGGKWAEIDDFEMDFEDVVVDVSSDPLAR